MVNQSNIAVVSDETVDIDDKIKQYVLETGSYAEWEVARVSGRTWNKKWKILALLTNWKCLLCVHC